MRMTIYRVYNTFPLTFYFQEQCQKVHRTGNTKDAIKYELKKERLSAR